MAQFNPDTIPVKEDDVLIPISKKAWDTVEADPNPLRQYLKTLIRKVNKLMQDVASAINSNEASSLIIPEGESLPTAERHYNGRLAMTEKSGGSSEDELYWCKWNGSAWAWEKII